jgi:hypothetical protein
MSDCIGTGCKAASLMARLETQAEAHAAEVAGLESVRAEQAAGREYWCNEAQRLTAERDALRVDAERYRWLRGIDSYATWNSCGHYAADALDAKIDAARAQGGTPT